nr:hypothetical protein BaRGS_001128 [Batillaria attramentaria]
MPDEWTLTQLIHAIAEFTVGLLCIFSNTLVLLAMYRNKSLRTVTYCFMASLALSDLLVGIAVPPLVILAHQGWPPDFHGCVLIKSLVILFTNISIFTMFDVTFDRYMAICHPVFHRRKMTITRAIRLLAVSWIVAIVLGLVPVMGWNNGKENFEGTCSFVAVISMKYMVYMMFLGVNVPLLVVMLTVYTYVFYVIRRVRKKTQKRSPAAVIEKGGKPHIGTTMPVEWTQTGKIYATSECVVGLMSIFSNTLVLKAIYRNKSLRTVTYCFTASLALSDLLVGIAVPPLVILAYIGLPPDFHGCLLINSLVILFNNISILTLVNLTFDRYLAICHPVFHRRKMTITRAIRLLAVTWVVAIVLGLVPVMGWNNGKENFTGTCSFVAVISKEYMVYLITLGVKVPVLVVMYVVYAYIFYVIRGVHKQTRTHLYRHLEKQASSSRFSPKNPPQTFFRQLCKLSGFVSVVADNQVSVQADVFSRC